MLASLETEFGPQFIVLAIISGELSGYSFTTWGALNQRLNEWCDRLCWSRDRVASQWEALWWEAVREASPSDASKALRAAIERRPCVDDDLADWNWEPIREPQRTSRHDSDDAIATTG